MSFDLKHLLSSRKFLPFYIDRRNIDEELLGPVAVEFHWTSFCNYSCVHCSYGSRRQMRSKLTRNVIEATINDLLHLKTRAVYLSGGGEPTTIKAWDKYAWKLINNGIQVALITNGVCLSESHRKLLEHINYIAVSVYSSDMNEYRSITGGDFFRKQFKLPSIIGRENESVIGARCVLNGINYKRVVSIYEKVMESGYDYIIFIPAVDYEDNEVSLRKDEALLLRDILDENIERFDLSRTNVDRLRVRGVAHYKTGNYLENLSVVPTECKAIAIRGNAFINYDGGVYLCQPHIGDIRYCIGNVNETRFVELWNSGRHNEVVTTLHEQFCQGLCKNCRSIEFNQTAYEYDVNPEIVHKIPEDVFI